MDDWRGRRRAELGADFEDLVHDAFFALPEIGEFRQFLFLLHELGRDAGVAVGVVEPDGNFALEDFRLRAQSLDAALAILDAGRRGVLADGHAGAGGIDKADGFIRKLPGRNVAVGEAGSGFERLVEHLDAMMFLEHGEKGRGS